MPRVQALPALLAAALALPAAATAGGAGGTPAGVRVSVDWAQVEGVSRTTATLQVVVNPLLRRGSPIHAAAFQALRLLEADQVRFVPWLPYPRLAVAELEPPRAGRTFWDFSLIDPLVADFYGATAGHPVVLNFSTTPQWLWKTAAPVGYPDDPDAVVWNYSQGRELRDPTGAELAAYYARVASWYARGGFTDELGRKHESGHAYPIPYWEILNEPDLEHELTPSQYTRLYDAVVTALRPLLPGTKFVGVSLAYPRRTPEFFEHFLDPKNHAAGVPLDAISYHFYASPSADESRETMAFTAFEEAEHFLTGVRFIEAIRRRLSPRSETMLNEIGMIADHLLAADQRIPGDYWNLAGAVYAYVWSRSAELGIEVVGESQLVGYPTQFPSVTMVDWTTGAPNARYFVLRLLKDSFAAGDRLVATSTASAALHARGFLKSDGQRRLLLVNKRPWPVVVALPSLPGARIACVDGATPQGIAASSLAGETLTLAAHAVAVVSAGAAR